MQSPQISIIVPTYNERQNIAHLLGALCSLRLKCEILVIDDSSPDGTAKTAREFSRNKKNISVIVRKERGLASAILCGVKHARSSVICVIDADMQHPPEIIPLLVESMKSNKSDIAVASRFLPGANIGFGMRRKLASKSGIALAHFILPRTKQCTDPLSGFFAFRKSVINGVQFDAIGFKFLLEMLARGKWARISEVPYSFSGRKLGRTKLGWKEYIRFSKLLLKLRLP